MEEAEQPLGAAPKMTEPPSPTRSRIMAAIRSTNTRPEMVVRRLTHGMGYRYRLHGARLPGRPDLVFASRRKAIFVHGCFWHQHSCPRGERTPKTNRAYWRHKLRRNAERDAQNLDSLRQLGWRALVIWECEIKDSDALEKRIRMFLDGRCGP